MKKITTVLLLTTAFVVAGCAKKHPAELPPPAGAPMQSGPADNGAGSIAPGTRADFERSVTSNTVHFALDSFDIDPQARAILDSQAVWLARYPNVPVSLEGHCDERGTREYNLALGDRRANATKNYLVARGVNPARISTISYGKERPIALGSDEASWAQNRRAVTIVLS
ncbi:MAG: peptidoglycan-associated lipoprotein Pal [Pseudomonadota bacterium]|nr:peptidoglycan-associated lipoprotein Pal [Pseudomonadota bacterium]